MKVIGAYRINSNPKHASQGWGPGHGTNTSDIPD